MSTLLCGIAILFQSSSQSNLKCLIPACMCSFLPKSYQVHRIGQTRPVVVKRFIMAKSVEERIVAVRRTLSNDKPGTAVCDSSLMTDVDPQKKPAAKRARTDGGNDDDGKDEAQYDGNAQLERLATIFNTTLVPSVYKA